MDTTTNVVGKNGFRESYRRHGYFFREAGTVIIGIGLFMHLYRVIYGDEMTLRHVMTPTTDKFMLVPMIYASITGIMLRPRVRFANKAHKIFFTWAVAYITLSVPLHFYCAVIRDNVHFYVDFFPMWFSYLLLPFYAVLLTMFWRLRFRD
jgi:hypothetical protein